MLGSALLNVFLVFLAVQEIQSPVTSNADRLGSRPAAPIAVSLRNGLGLQRAKMTAMEPQDVANGLRSLGFPKSVVDRAVGASLDEKYHYEELSRAVRIGYPGARARLLAASQLTKEGLKEIIGLDVENGVAAQRTKRLVYGELDEAKIRAVKKIEAEFPRHLESEMRERLMLVLAPEEVEDYLLFNSYIALQAQNRLSIFDLEESTYRAIYDAERQRAAAIDNLIQAEVELSEKYRTILGDERFLVIIPRFDRLSSSLDAVYAESGIAPSERSALFIANYAAMLQIQAAKGAERKALASKMYAALLDNPAFSNARGKVRLNQTPLGQYLNEASR